MNGGECSVETNSLCSVIIAMYFVDYILGEQWVLT